MARYRIKGDYAIDGFISNPNQTLLIEKVMGNFIDYELGQRITVTRVGLGPIELRVGSCAWRFWPDDGECERIGLPVQQVA